MVVNAIINERRIARVMRIFSNKSDINSSFEDFEEFDNDFN